jgi:hypothetical protein
LSLFARAPRPRAPNSSAAAERALERQASAERERELAEAERERALVFERERVLEEERLPSAPSPAMSLWPAGIRRPTRGRRW